MAKTKKVKEKAPVKVKVKTALVKVKTALKKVQVKRVPPVGTIVHYYTLVQEPKKPDYTATHAAIVTGTPYPDPEADPAPVAPVHLAVFVAGTGVVWQDNVSYGPGKPEHWGGVGDKP